MVQSKGHVKLMWQRSVLSMMGLCLVLLFFQSCAKEEESTEGVRQTGQMEVLQVDLTGSEKMLGSYVVHLTFDPSQVAVLDVSGGKTKSFSQNPITQIDHLTGNLWVTEINQNSLTSPSGLIELLQIAYEGDPNHLHPFQLASIQLKDTEGRPLLPT